jgi:hypothetical protein
MNASIPVQEGTLTLITSDAAVSFSNTSSRSVIALAPAPERQSARSQISKVSSGFVANGPLAKVPIKLCFTLRFTSVLHPPNPRHGIIM